MKYTQLGDTGIKVSKVTMGCWAIGSGKEWGKSLGDTVYMETIEQAVDEGITFFDTAQGYGSGHSEKLLGAALESCRDDVVISTKIGASGLVEENYEENVNKSLERLKTDYIDVLFVHWPNPDIDIRHNMQLLQKLKDKKVVRAIGISNCRLEHLKLAKEVADLDVIQPCYNLFWRHPEKDILPYCTDNNIGVITYTSIASGLLTGKFNKNSSFEKTDQRNEVLALFQPEVFNKAVDAVVQIKEIAKRYNKTIVQTAINWTANKKGVTSPIVGAKTPKQISENAGSVDFELKDSDIIKMDKIGREIADMVANWDTMYRKNDVRLDIDY